MSVMKLNEYIFNKISELDYLIHNEIPSEDVIEKWIVEWYRTTFKNDALPPQWLANWRINELD